MKHNTYQLLKKAYLGNVDHSALFQVLQEEKDPFVQRAVRLAAQMDSIKFPWDTRPFQDQFRQGTPQERLDQTVMMFLLRLVAVVKEEMHIRTFRKPESHEAVQAWISLLKHTIFTTLTLLYNVRWTVKHFFLLDNLIFDLVHEGRVSALRQFMTEELHISMTDTPTLAERHFEKLNFLNIAQFGSSFWRLLHWMAEAMDLRDAQSHPDIEMAKQVWRELITEPLYRLLRCGICMAHMRHIVQELRSELLDESTQYKLLWFNIHNKVTSKRMYYTSGDALSGTQSTYSESELEEDAAFMRQGLVP
ncbi:sulfhydryl oxidase [Nephila pilipes]|uniref:Sulfhydryl oxidase n=1 Tax=Nephila pilipes TaxID=299642 RepID=A0A8X6NQM9_NEPPI|nr:sulfhydryl oxidase [Nephila pilipes]